MAKWTGYYKVVTPATDTTKITDSQRLGDQGTYGNYSWYQRLVQGSASRISRYREYDMMDYDVDVARALDTVAEDMTSNSTGKDIPIELDLTADTDTELPNNTVPTLRAALRHWCHIHDWENRLFKVARTVIKYGDCFFRKNDKLKRWVFIHPKQVTGAIVDADDVSKIVGWQVKKNIKKARSSFGTPVNGSMETETEIVPAAQMVHFTLNSDMDDSAPFGESVLRPVYKAFKQKELLEDSVLIYRIQRAPERRVFYIDVGKMPPQRVKTYLESIKNEIKQKKVPTIQGGQSKIESVYNPQSMSEDFFFAQRADGKGSRVETLPGGQGLGELADLEYFLKKVLRGLRIPASQMGQMSDNQGGGVFNDNKVGVAYIEEIRFSTFVERLQGHIEGVIDREFKKYLYEAGIKVDTTAYRLRLPSATNFVKYRQQEIDAALLSAYGSADGVSYLSKRFIMSRYLQLTDEEIQENELMRREELSIDPDSQAEEDILKLYNPEAAQAEMEAGGMEAGGGEMGMEAGGEAGGEELEL